MCVAPSLNLVDLAGEFHKTAFSFCASFHVTMWVLITKSKADGTRVAGHGPGWSTMLNARACTKPETWGLGQGASATA